MDGKTQLVGIIGHPVGHSLSPRLHNACFEVLKMNWQYVPLPVQPGQVPQALAGLDALGFRGANVTVPHKEAVLAYLTEVDALAGELGAVNTILVDRQETGVTLKGYNTDLGGFLAGLHEAGMASCQGCRVVMAGAGGAARAVLAALLLDGATEVTLLNRSVERAQRLADEKRGHRAAIHVHALTDEILVEACRGADLLVNTTSLGMNPQPQGSIWPDSAPLPAGMLVYDLVYAPLETRLLAQARASGAKPVDGLSMLIHQAALAFEIWTGVMPPLDVMRRAAQQHLEGRN